MPQSLRGMGQSVPIIITITFIMIISLFHIIFIYGLFKLSYCVNCDIKESDNYNRDEIRFIISDQFEKCSQQLDKLSHSNQKREKSTILVPFVSPLLLAVPLAIANTTLDNHLPIIIMLGKLQKTP